MKGILYVYCNLIPKNGSSLLTLSPKESHHLSKVLRAKAGDAIVAIDGKGLTAQCRLEIPHPKEAQLSIISQTKLLPPSYPIILALCIPKGKVMDGVVRKATELGVFSIIPLLSKQTEVKVKNSQFEEKSHRFQDIAIESCKQSGNPFCPEIKPCIPIEAFFQNPPEGIRLVASLDENRLSLNQVITEETLKTPQSITILIGPEGDLTKAEYLQAYQAGFKPIRLSKNVLRVETAAIYAISILDYAIQSINSQKRSLQ